MFSISISNKHEEFFDYLIKNAENFHQGAVLAQTVFKDIGQLPEHLPDIIELEHNTDETNHEIIEKLAVVFITPIDREDFYRLTCALEACVDNLQGAVLRLSMYHVSKPLPSASRIVDHIVSMSLDLKAIFSMLKDIDRNEGQLIEKADHLNELESAIDKLYRDEISRLFDGSYELIDVIRWKNVYAALEDTADKVETLAYIIKEVTMKYA